MPFDGTTLHCIAHELKNELCGGRVDKIHQISKEQLRISVRTKAGVRRMLLSASADSARIHLTTTPATNPSQPPMFCMLLRKRIGGGIIKDIKQFELERIIEITIEARDDLGRKAEYIFRHEIMGKHSNIILTHNNIIIDSLKRIDYSKSRVREILPQLEYAYPPKQDKLDPTMMDKKAFQNLLLAHNELGYAKILSQNLLGLSMQGARYLSLGQVDYTTPISNLSGNDVELIAQNAFEFYTKLKENDLDFYLLVDSLTHEVKDFIMHDKMPTLAENCEIFDSVSNLVDTYYSKKELDSQLKQATSSLMQSLKIILKRTKKKLKKIEAIINDSASAEKFKLYGELLTAYQAQVPKGAKEVELLNYYSTEGEMVMIPLDPIKTANVNAQKYYKKYNKLHRAMDLAVDQIIETKTELEYLESMEHAINNCGDLNAAKEIQEEFVVQGYVKKHIKKDKRKFKPSMPRHYISSDGYDIYIGRNNKQNDQLTMKFAKADDLFLHTQKIPGSHVIIKAIDGQISEQAISEAAVLAAYNSKAKTSSNVPVDYTLRKNIKKPNGSKPGYVIYSTHSTINATPNITFINEIKEIVAE